MTTERIVPGQGPEEVRAVVRRYADETIRPLIPHEREWLEPAEDRVPWDAIEVGSRIGLRTLGAPVDRGGAGASVLTLCVAVEELARADMGVAVAFDQTWKCQETIESLGTSEQKDWFYDRFFMHNDRCLLAIAVTEPETGTDKYIFPEGKLATTAVRVEGGWRINGKKRYISNGADAELALIFAQTTPKVPLDRGVTCFLVPTDSEGFRIGRIHEKISQRLVNNAELILENVFVPDDRILGEQDAALARVGDSSDIKYVRGGNAEAAATTLGTALAAYDAAMEYATERRQGGRPIIEHQAIGHRLAEIATDLEASRSLVWRAARAVDEQGPDVAKLIAMAKHHASATAVSVALRATEVFGGAGIMMDEPIQKYLRDTLSFLHSDGTQATHAHRILDQLRKEFGL